MSESICEAFGKVAELCMARHEEPLTKYPGCWECTIDEHWKIAVNGHAEPKVCSLSTLPIEPFHCFIDFNGWPAGLMSPYGGTIAAGEAANEVTFIEAVNAAIERATK